MKPTRPYGLCYGGTKHTNSLVQNRTTRPAPVVVAVHRPVVVRREVAGVVAMEGFQAAVHQEAGATVALLQVQILADLPQDLSRRTQI